MTDLLNKSLWPFPAMRFSSLVDEDDNWPATTGGGLSLSDDDTHVYVEAQVPGVREEDIETTYHKGVLWIKASSKDEESDKKKGRRFFRIASSSFQYRVAVPGDIDEKVEPEASYQNGILTVKFTKKAEIQPKKISIKKS